LTERNGSGEEQQSSSFHMWPSVYRNVTVGQDGILRRVANPSRLLRRLAIGAQVTNLPHKVN